MISNQILKMFDGFVSNFMDFQWFGNKFYGRSSILNQIPWIFNDCEWSSMILQWFSFNPIDFRWLLIKFDWFSMDPQWFWIKFDWFWMMLQWFWIKFDRNSMNFRCGLTIKKIQGLTIKRIVISPRRAPVLRAIFLIVILLRGGGREDFLIVSPH